MVKADASQKRRAAKAAKRVITSGAQRRGSGVVATAKATRDFYNRSYLFTFEEVSAIHEALQAPPPGDHTKSWMYPHWMSAARKAYAILHGDPIK